MADKHAPRRPSALAGAHPVSTTKRPPSAPTASPAVSTARSVSTTKFSPNVDTAVLDDVKDAFWVARNIGRYRTFGDLVTEALRDKVTALRDELNDGEPFPKRPVDNLPSGRVAG